MGLVAYGKVCRDFLCDSFTIFNHFRGFLLAEVGILLYSNGFLWFFEAPS